MPRRYRKTTRRPRKRTYRRKNYRKGNSSRRLTDNTVYSFKRTAKYTNVVSTATPGTFTAGAFTFSLSQLPQNSDFTTLYDAYKITGVRLTFMPRANDVTLTANGGVFMYVMDYDDATAFATTDDILQHQSLKMKTSLNNGKPFSIFVRPKAASAFYNGVTVSGYGQSVRNQWLDAANPTIPYYGVKWVWTNSSAVVEFDVYATYYMKFKTVR